MKTWIFYQWDGVVLRKWNRYRLMGPGAQRGMANTVLAGEGGSINSLSFRDPKSFREGGVHAHKEPWKSLASGYKNEAEVNEWISRGVDFQSFFRPFKGIFGEEKFDSPMPPQKVLKNHQSWNKFADLITETLEQRVKMGGVTVLGKVGEVYPPNIILPITIGPWKLRLCIDVRFLNLQKRDAFLLKEANWSASFCL